MRLSVQACQAHVDMLKSTVQARAAAKTDTPQGVAHLHGVVLIVTERLAAVAAAFDRCREVRFKKVLAEAERKRRRAPPRVRSRDRVPSRRKRAPRLPPHPTSPGRAADGPARQTQLGGDSDDLLMEELTGTPPGPGAAEASVLEMSALRRSSRRTCTRRLAQIETLYSQAVESTRRLESGNVELKKTIARRGDSQIDRRSSSSSRRSVCSS